MPQRRMHLSRQHGILSGNGRALIRAAHLSEELGLARVQANRPNTLRYIHLCMQKHQLVQVEGVWTETYYLSATPHQGAPQPTTKLSPHKKRCRPLLSRAQLRATPEWLHRIGQLGRQPVPSIRPEADTASAPAGVSP
ncbi:Hint domain-containing protein [Sulfitobacter noctilucicola]|uniref:Hint domain-containing protein n=1 Tax=Sulfitobacter noctilucicola TaxID=1342301 RepID=UPI003B97DF8C